MPACPPSPVQDSRFLLVLLILLCVGSAPETSPPTPLPETVEEHLRIRIEAIQDGAPDAASVDGEPLLATEEIARYYRQAAFQPVWAQSAGPTARADSLLTHLQAANRDGLRSADYHVATIDSLLGQLRAKAETGEPLTPGRLVDLELLCTDAVLLYASHLQNGRTDPTAISSSWTAERQATDLVQHLEHALTQSSLRAALAKLRPPQPEYDALRRALARYRTLEGTGGWPSVPEGTKLEEGVTDPHVPRLRQRLRATGDLSAVPPTADSLTFGAPLHQAVTRFQERHGLAVDGVVGPATRAALNVSVEARIQQIEINLERWRWLPPDLGALHVRVNIAGFDLRVVENGADRLRMRVVVGQAYRQTPVFSDQISYLVFNPYWHVPHSIATKDKLPDFQQNPSRVSTEGFEVFRGWGADAAQVDPSTIDWRALSASNFPYRLRQRPGPQNALGEVKFMFPNPHSVYLHDTPSRSLFGRAERSFSSGCIRVEHPLDLATILLRPNEGWTRTRIQAAVRTDTEQTVPLAQKVPVHLLYWTAWAEDGTVHFRRDVYDRDGAVHSALTAPLGGRSDRADVGSSSPNGP